MCTFRATWIFDPKVLREKYRAERDRRIRPDGLGKYRPADGRFAHFPDDPQPSGWTGEPLDDRVEVVVVGGGFGGLVAAARLRMAGVADLRWSSGVVTLAAPGTGTATRHPPQHRGAPIPMAPR